MIEDPVLVVDPVYGLDIAFDLGFQPSSRKDIFESPDGDDVATIMGEAALAQELQRMFDLTPIGSFVDDPSYGCDWGVIGTSMMNVQIAIATTRIGVLRALSHPSFKERFKVRSLVCTWNPSEPGTIRVNGVLRLLGQNTGLYSFGYRLRTQR